MPNVYVLAAWSNSHEKNAFFAFPSLNAIIITEISDFCLKKAGWTMHDTTDDNTF